MPRLEIDISIPDKKIAISWDGIGHRKPVFGEKAFKKVCKNDIKRDEVLKNTNWKYISVIDNGTFNPQFVEDKVKQIIELVNKEWEGKVII